MSEIFKIGPTPAKVTVARPIGRAATADESRTGGARPVESVPPVILDNDDARSFLRKGLRQEHQNRSTDQLADRPASQPAALRDEPRSRRTLPDYAGELQADTGNRDAGADRSPTFGPVLARSSSNGFVVHVIAQNGATPDGLSSSEFAPLADRHLRSSDAYRRAGAEPLLYSQTAQMISIAI